MLFSAFHGMKPLPQLMVSIFVILVCFLGCMFLATIIAIPFWGTGVITGLNSMHDLGDPGTIRLLKYLQMVQSVGLFIIPPIILAWIFHGQIKKYLFLNQNVTRRSLLLVAFLMITSLPLINLTGEWNGQMAFPDWLSGLEQWMKQAEANAAELTEAFLVMDGLPALAFNLIMIAILPAIGEELLFRGVIQRIFSRWTRSIHWGIWISAILFSALHLQFYGFLPRMLLGVMFGYLLVWSGTIWVPILAHLFNNGFAVIAMYLIDRELLSPKVEEIGSTAESLYLSLISAGITLLLLWMIRRENRPYAIGLTELEA